MVRVLTRVFQALAFAMLSLAAVLCHGQYSGNI